MSSLFSCLSFSSVVVKFSSSSVVISSFILSLYSINAGSSRPSVSISALSKLITMSFLLVLEGSLLLYVSKYFLFSGREYQALKFCSSSS